jgi:polyprenyl-phospho-N-acetylgalactosaminyl synthase
VALSPGPTPPTSLPTGLWVVVPAYNEELRIGPVLKAILTVAPSVVVVDDGSADGTAEQVLKTSAWLIRHPVNLGQGAALQTGLQFALERGATHLVTFDADGQHTADSIGRLVSALADHRAEFALGSRFLGHAEGIPWSRRLILRLGLLFTRLVSGVRLSDTYNGLRAMTRRGAEHIRITFNGMEHASEIIDQIARSGLRYVEVPVLIIYTAQTLRKGVRTNAALGLGLRFLLNKVIR